LPHIACNIHSIIDNRLIFLQNQTNNKIDINKDFTTRPHMIAGNESKLHQALLSILSNAVQSIENEGMINIQTTKQNNRLLITIIDS